MPDPRIHSPAIPPAAGLYPDVGFADYRRWRAWNQSTLKTLGEWDALIAPAGGLTPAPWKSPAHTLAAIQDPEQATEAQRLGSDYHALLFEPERFKREYGLLKHKIDRRTNEGKAAWASLVAEYGEDRVVNLDRWNQMNTMARTAAANGEVRNLVAAKGDHELSAAWIDAETGAACKGRFDKVVKTPSGKVWLIDLKSTRCSHPRMFAKDAARYQYHVQAAFYMDGYEAATGTRPERFLIIAQETTAPFPAVVYNVRAEELDSGRRIYRAGLRLIEHCTKTNDWPGYADGRAVDLILDKYAHADEHESIS